MWGHQPLSRLTLLLLLSSFAAAPMEAVKRTYQPSTVKRHHTHGFLVRMRSKNGRRTIARKKEKGRHKLGI